jgi:hypothetical protein
MDGAGRWNPSGTVATLANSLPEFAQLRQKNRYIVLDDAPKYVVVNTEIPMNQTVACGDDQPLGNQGIRLTDLIGNMDSSLTDQLQIADGGIVVQTTGNESLLIESSGYRR